MTSDEMQKLLEAHNIGFAAKDIPHGRQFRLVDGAIANVYGTGNIVWQGKDTDIAARVKALRWRDHPGRSAGSGPSEIVR